MSTINIKFDIKELATIEPYIEKTKEKLASHNLVQNPFYGDVDIKGDIIHLDITPVYPNVSLYAFISTLGIILFIQLIYPAIGFRFSFWYLLPGFFLLTAIPYTDWFMYQMFKKGMRKAGYMGKLKRIKGGV
jgi:hypothetical protein